MSRTAPQEPGAEQVSVGDECELTITAVAHGGHVIGHHGGRTYFVRHALPGERVRARVTEVNRRIVRADAVEVLDSSPDRVSPPCGWSGPGGCGGCDFQHASVASQRAMKSEVLTTSLMRFGGLDEAAVKSLDSEVHELPGHPDGLRWRTRMRWATDSDGRRGLRRHRSHEVVPVDRCLLAAPGIDAPDDLPRRGNELVHVREREWSLDAGSFWQVHDQLPEALVSAVLEFGRPEPGETWWDLFAGAGLFAAFLGQEVGSEGEVVAVETAASAVAAGECALGDLSMVRFVNADVPDWLEHGDLAAPDGLVLDPPRQGAGERLMAELCDAEIPRMVYVACDPVALARDVRVAREHGYRLERLRALDAFPMTHHFETVALITRP